jgi:hypothetical protein
MSGLVRIEDNTKKELERIREKEGGNINTVIQNLITKAKAYDIIEAKESKITKLKKGKK